MLSGDYKTYPPRDPIQSPVWRLIRSLILVVPILLTILATNCRMTEKTEPLSPPNQELSKTNDAIAHESGFIEQLRRVQVRRGGVREIDLLPVVVRLRPEPRPPRAVELRDRPVLLL